MVAQQLALRHPRRVRSLVLGATQPGGRRAVRPDDDVLAFFRRRSEMRNEEAAWASVAYNYGPRCRELHVDRATRFKGGLIVAFREINDRTSAEQWRNRFFLVPRAEVASLAEGEVYVHELLGMHVQLETGESVGEVADVYELPQGLAIDVRRTGHDDTFLLLYDQSVRSVNRDAGVVIVTIPEGLLDE